MRNWILFLIIGLVLQAPSPEVFGAPSKENTLWKVVPSRANAMVFFGKRIVDVNRARVEKLIPYEFGWQGNETTFIFRLTSRQLNTPYFELSFKVLQKDYENDIPVKLNIDAGTNINRVKPVIKEVVIDEIGTYKIKISSSFFYLGNQNFIRILGANVRPIGYGTSPPNCRFEYIKLAIPKDTSEGLTTPVVFEAPTETEYRELGIGSRTRIKTPKIPPKREEVLEMTPQELSSAIQNSAIKVQNFSIPLKETHEQKINKQFDQETHNGYMYSEHLKT